MGVACTYVHICARRRGKRRAGGALNRFVKWKYDNCRITAVFTKPEYDDYRAPENLSHRIRPVLKIADAVKAG